MPQHSVKRKGKKPWLLNTSGRNNTSAWPSLAHQASQTTEVEKDFYREQRAMGMFGYDRLVHGFTQWILMTPAYPQAFGTDRLLFQSAETPYQPGVLSGTKGERTREEGDGRDSEQRVKMNRRQPSQTQLTHKLRVCKIVVSRLHDTVCQGWNCQARKLLQ